MKVKLHIVKLAILKPILNQIEPDRTESNQFDFITANRTYSNFLLFYFIFICFFARIRSI